jgi:hypothetical protein
MSGSLSGMGMGAGLMGMSPLALAMLGIPGGGGAGKYNNSTSPTFPTLDASKPLAPNAVELQKANPSLPWYAVPSMFQTPPPPPATAAAATPQGDAGGMSVAGGGVFDPATGRVKPDFGGGFDVNGMPLFPASNPMSTLLNNFNAGNWPGAGFGNPGVGQ